MWFGQRRLSLAAAAFQAFHQQEAVVVQLLRIHQRNSIGDLCVTFPTSVSPHCSRPV